jgi:hypothetical protein
MSAETMRHRVLLLLTAAVLVTGCATVTPAPTGRSAFRATSPNEPPGTQVAMVSPGGMTVRAVTSGAVRVDAFEELLRLAGLENLDDLPPRAAAFSPPEAARVLALLLRKPVTLASFPPRMAASYLLREVLAGKEVSRDELLHRVDRFKSVAVLRPDGYLAWTLNGRTQQKVGPLEWRNEAFRAGPFELGCFYSSNGWVFRRADAQLRPMLDGPAPTRNRFRGTRRTRPTGLEVRARRPEA